MPKSQTTNRDADLLYAEDIAAAEIGTVDKCVTLRDPLKYL